MQFPTRPGWIEVIFGPMFSGKTEELIRRLRVASFGKGKVLAVRPQRDTRSARGRIEAHSGTMLEALVIDSPAVILGLVNDSTTVVGIDEAQFFDAGALVRVCEELALKGVRVIVAGLDLDFERKPFEWFIALVGQAEESDKLTSLCSVCGNRASFSQRIDGSDERIQVGGEDLYQPRCRHCFVPT
jgi:thymidine kinase